MRFLEEFFTLLACGPTNGLNALDTKGLDDGFRRHVSA
jgi:hypothetical protein